MVTHARWDSSRRTVTTGVSSSSLDRRQGCRRALGKAIALAALIGCVSTSLAQAEPGPASCDRVASTQGSDSSEGSAAAPFRTAQKLLNSLAPGQVGCLRGGTYAGGLRVNHGGAASAPITLRSYPGERALITGRVYVPRGSDYVTVADLALDGNYQAQALLPSPTVDANHVTFESDDITSDHTGICFDIGSAGWGVADSTVITGSRIHDCGVLPAVNLQHGIYVTDATNVRITHNLIDHNADRGIQLYPSSIGGVITDNVIAYNGEGIIFSGGPGGSSNNNLVQHNLVVNSLIRSDIESWYPAGSPLGSGNLVSENCVSTKGIDSSVGGFNAQGNVTAAAGDIVAVGAGYAVQPGSACAAVIPDLVLGGAAPVATPQPPASPAARAAAARPPHRRAAHARRASHGRRKHAGKRQQHRRKHVPGRRHRPRSHRRGNAVRVSHSMQLRRR
jgi:parallel beta-helix repeat protein